MGKDIKGVGMIKYWWDFINGRYVYTNFDCCKYPNDFMQIIEKLSENDGA